MDQSRRKFVQQTLLGSLGLIAGIPALKAGEPKRLSELGLIVGVLQKELEKDWRGTLRKVAEIGYTYLEFGKYYGQSRSSFKLYLNETGLKPLAGGSAMAQMKNEAFLKEMIDDALFLGKKYLICYWPWIDSGENKKLDDFKKAAEDLNTIGEHCNKAGIRFAMHNHDKEFVPVQGYQSGYEVLLKESDSSKVAMLLDLYWATKGGADVLQLLKDYPNRFELFHVKDMDKSAEKLYTCPGYGILDFKKIFAQAAETSVKHYIVEIDRADQPMTCIQDSFSYLKNLQY